MKLKLTALLAAGLLSVGSGFAATLSVTPAPNQSANGGPFIIQTSDIGTFYGFCLEVPEPLSYSTNFEYFSSDAAYNGGAGGGNPDIISKGSVYLMETYGNSIAGLSVTDARNLQLALWILEDEIAVDFANPYIIEVIGEFGSIVNANSNYLALGLVRVLNPFIGQGQETVQRQSLIVLTHPSVPDAGTSLMLLGLGLGSLGLISRRFRR
jgi:hypothetical protein